MFTVQVTRAQLVELENVTGWVVKTSVEDDAWLEYDDGEISLREGDDRAILGHVYAGLVSEEQRDAVIALLKKWRDR